MKKLLSYSLLLLAFSSCNPYKNLVDNTVFPDPFKFSETDTVQASKDQLYTNAYEWMAKTLAKNGQSILMHDRTSGKLIGTSYVEIPLLNKMVDSIKGYDPVYFDVCIEVQDGKYRCTLSDFYHRGRFKYSSKDAGNIYGRSYGSLDQLSVGDSTQIKRSDEWLWIKNNVMAQTKDVFSSVASAMRKRENNWSE